MLAGGYVSEENFARADADGLRLLAPLAKDPGRTTPAPPTGPAPRPDPPPPAPSGASNIPAAATITGCGSAPWNQYSDS